MTTQLGGHNRAIRKNFTTQNMRTVGITIFIYEIKRDIIFIIFSFIIIIYYTEKRNCWLVK